MSEETNVKTRGARFGNTPFSVTAEFQVVQQRAEFKNFPPSSCVHWSKAFIVLACLPRHNKTVESTSVEVRVNPVFPSCYILIHSSYPPDNPYVDGRGMCREWGEGRGVPRVLVWKPEGKRPLGRPRRRWEDNIKMDLQEVGGVVGTGWSWLRIGTGGGHL